MNFQLESPVFSLCHSSTCGYNYLRAGGREGHLYLLDTTGDKFEEITVSNNFDMFHDLPNATETGIVNGPSKIPCLSKFIFFHKAMTLILCNAKKGPQNTDLFGVFYK